jgi:hypothetical protein
MSPSQFYSVLCQGAAVPATQSLRSSRPTASIRKAIEQGLQHMVRSTRARLERTEEVRTDAERNKISILQT